MLLSDYHRYRLYEILPGLSIWLTLILSVAFSFFKPLWMIYAVIVFDIYWVLRVSYFSFYMVLSWRRFYKAVRTDWQKKLVTEFPNWTLNKNVVFLPFYNEGWDVIDTTLTALIASSYPADKIFVVISGEGRRLAKWETMQEKIKNKYTDRFADLLFYTHPDGLPDELPGKGSNIHHAEFEFKKYADARDWNYDNIIMSVFDVDTVVHPEYFSHLTYIYWRNPNPTRSSYQPVTLYNNNIWESPSVLRLMAFGTSFWMLFSLGRLDGLVTFSSHSMSFRAAMNCGGHAKDIVSEDSRIFFQSWFAHGGNYDVTPLYIPVSMDTVRDDSWFKSLKNLYLQQRRWAWGTENIPYLLWNFGKHKEISRWKKIVILFHEWEGKWSWAVVALLITVLGRLPTWFADDAVRQSALFFYTPHVLETLMQLAMFGLFLSALMGILILPPRPDRHPRYRYLFLVLQWLLVPISLVIFSAIPCIDAVTHLMFGKYLGFNVSTKKRS